MPSLAASASPNLAANTETFVWSLTDGTAGSFFLQLDGSNLLAGTILTVRAYIMVVQGGNRLVADLSRPIIGTLSAEGERYWRTPPYTNALAADATGTLRFSLTATVATVVPWSVVQL